MCNFGKNFTVTLVALYSKPHLLLNIQGHQASYCKCITHEKWSPLAYLLSALAASLSASLFDAPSWGEHAAGNTKPPSHFWAGRHLPSAAGRQWQGGWVGLGSCDLSWTLAVRWIRYGYTAFHQAIGKWNVVGQLRLTLDLGSCEDKTCTNCVHFLINQSVSSIWLLYRKYKT